jgi:hypothetical protein
MKPKFIEKILMFTVALFYTIYRVVNAYLTIPFWDNYDSPAYFKLEFFPSFRPHGVTLLFALLKNESAISIFHAVLGSLVWIYLWIVIWQILKSKIVKILFTFLYFILASSAIILEHDSSILSESLAISSTVFLLASALNVYLKTEEDDSVSLSILGFAILWFASTKSSNSLLLPILVGLFMLRLIKSKNKFFVSIAIGIVALFGTFIFVNTFSTNTTQSLNTSATINNRIIKVESWKKDLINSGYPKNAINTWEEFSKNNLGIPPDQAVVNLPEFKQWWLGGGDKFLVRFIFQNPDYGFYAPIAIPLISREFSFRDTLLSGWSQGTDLIQEHNGFSRSLLTRTFFWPDEPEKAYLCLALSFFLIGLSLLIFSFRKSFDFFNLFFTIFLLTIIWSYFNWWFGSKPTDMARHNLSAAVVIKLLSTISIFFALEKKTYFKKHDKVKNHGSLS